MGCRENGNVTIMALAFMGCLALALILALEVACAYAQKTALDNCLNIAREETFASGFDMQIKSSDDPGDLIASKIVSSLRRNGYEGSVEVQFYEATEEEIEEANPLIDDAANVRVLVYQVLARRDYSNTVAAASLFEGGFLASSITASLCPYSLHKTYRPDNSTGKVMRYTSRGKDDGMLLEEEETTRMWPALKTALHSSLSKPTDIYNANQ